MLLEIEIGRFRPLSTVNFHLKTGTKKAKPSRVEGPATLLTFPSCAKLCLVSQLSQPFTEPGSLLQLANWVIFQLVG